MYVEEIFKSLLLSLPATFGVCFIVVAVGDVVVVVVASVGNDDTCTIKFIK